MFQVFFYTGMRTGELLALTYADLDLDSNIISINKTATFKGGNVIITPPKTPKKYQRNLYSSIASRRSKNLFE